MRKIVTAVSAAALSLSMLASAVPALAVTGYDSAYAGESAFVNISPGQTQNFQVFFANTGTTTWSRGTGTQVDLAACLSDKVTCNAVDPANAAWNSGWLSTTRYATTTQTTTAPGSLGTFSYNVAAPSTALAGNYRFNGDLVLSTTGEKIHPEGYYQDATIGGAGSGAASLTSLTPTSGTTVGGTSVSITGTGFVCTPAFPSVSFGGTNAAVTSCGGTSVVATSPAHAKGSVTVTVTNSGQAASNGLTFTFVDLTPPQFTAMSVASNVVTVTYSKPVCRLVAFAAGQTDWAVKNVTNSTNDALTGDNTPLCDSATAPTTGVTTANLFLTTALPPGAFVEVDINQNTPASPLNPTPASAAGTCKPASLSTCNTNFIDASGNTMVAPQGQTASAQSAPGGAPTIASATGAVGTSTVTVNFSQAIFCPAATQPTVPGHFTLSSGGTGDPTFTGFVTTPCPTLQQNAITAFKLGTSKTLPSNTTYTLTFTPTANNEITNVFNVSLVNPPGTASVTFTTGAADVTPPIIVDADITAKSTGGSDFGFAGDAFILTFSKKMDGTGTNGCSSGAPSCTISIQDQDGTIATLTCGGKVTCTWDSGAATNPSTNLTVAVVTTLTGPNTTGGVCTGACDITAGTTPGMAIPFSITAITGMWDASTNKNPVNVLGSTDRLVEYPSEVGG
jgi:hypothetical protein